MAVVVRCSLCLCCCLVFAFVDDGCVSVTDACVCVACWLLPAMRCSLCVASCFVFGGWRVLSVV